MDLFIPRNTVAINNSKVLDSSDGDYDENKLIESYLNSGSYELYLC